MSIKQLPVSSIQSLSAGFDDIFLIHLDASRLTTHFQDAILYSGRKFMEVFIMRKDFGYASHNEVIQEGIAEHMLPMVYKTMTAELAAMKRQGDLINSALNIIEKLSLNSFADEDYEGHEELWGNENVEELKNLIISARHLVDNNFWPLKENKKR